MMLLLRNAAPKLAFLCPDHDSSLKFRNLILAVKDFAAAGFRRQYLAAAS